VTAREVIQRIERLGGVYAGAQGSHRKYVVRYGDRGRATTFVPVHPGDVPKGTLRKIERELEPALGERWLRRWRTR
jgi:predicted RNA binding protein YcfA (HicA-like mRNA interferase family)